MTHPSVDSADFNLSALISVIASGKGQVVLVSSKGAQHNQSYNLSSKKDLSDICAALPTVQDNFQCWTHESLRETAEMGSTNGRQHGLPMASNKCSMGTKNVPPTAIDFTGLDFTNMHANHNASSTNKAAQFSVSPPLKAMHANECVYYIQLTNSNGSWMLKPGFLTQTFEMIARNNVPTIHT